MIGIIEEEKMEEWRRKKWSETDCASIAKEQVISQKIVLKAEERKVMWFFEKEKTYIGKKLNEWVIFEEFEIHGSF